MKPCVVFLHIPPDFWNSPHPEVVWILDLCQQIRCSLSLRTYISCTSWLSSSGGKMEHTGRTLCVPLGNEDDGIVYTNCSQFPCFPDSRMKYGILICLSTAVKKLQDLHLILPFACNFRRFLQSEEAFQEIPSLFRTPFRSLLIPGRSFRCGFRWNSSDNGIP